jgi:hypothetical protein
MQNGINVFAGLAVVFLYGALLWLCALIEG